MPITYDPKETTLLYAGALIQDFAPDTHIEVEFNSRRYATSVGADGKGLRSKRNDRSAIVRITLQPGSLSNTFMQGAMAADEAGNAGALPLSITQKGTARNYTAASAWVAKDPEMSLGTEAEGQVWELETDELVPVIGSVIA